MSSSRGSYRPRCGLTGRRECLHCPARQGSSVNSGCCSKRQRPGGVKQQEVTSPGWRPESKARWPAELGEARLRTEDSLCPLMVEGHGSSRVLSTKHQPHSCSHTPALWGAPALHTVSPGPSPGTAPEGQCINAPHSAAKPPCVPSYISP